MKKNHKKLFSKSSKNLPLFIIIGVSFLVLFSLVMYVQNNNSVLRSNAENGNQSSVFPPLSPDKGCKQVTLDDENSSNGYECDIKIKNISDEDMEWFGIIDGLNGAKLADDAMGTIAPNETGVAKLLVPESVCFDNPGAVGQITIIDSNKSSYQGIATFNCKK